MTQHTEHNYEAEIKKEIKEIQSTLKEIKNMYLKEASQLAHKVPEAIQKGEDKVVQAVEEHPLSSVGLAAAVGFVLGAIFTRK